MTSRGLPPISRSDLRDHATPERIDRIWERVSADLAPPSPFAYPRSRFVLAALAASLAAFAVGVTVGKSPLVSHEVSVPAASVPDAAPKIPSSLVEVFAAGTQGRTFALPGGGHVILSPGATVELVDRSGDSIRLRIVQGEVAVETAGASPFQRFDLIAEDTVLSATTGAALRVSRRGDDIDISVSDGQVDVRSPSGSRSLRGGERTESLSIRAAVAANHAPVVRPRASAARVFSDPAPAVALPAQPTATADWHAKSSANDIDEAFRLMRDQPGGIDGAIASASSAAELMEIRDVVAGREPAAAIRALIRIVDSFPGDPYAQYAAYKLGTLYQKLGQAEQARAYFERAERAPGALAEDAFYQRFHTAPTAEEAARAARDYLAKYPEGSHRDEAERVLAGDDVTIDPASAPPDQKPDDQRNAAPASSDSSDAGGKP